MNIFQRKPMMSTIKESMVWGFLVVIFYTKTVVNANYAIQNLNQRLTWSIETLVEKKQLKLNAQSISKNASEQNQQKKGPIQSNDRKQHRQCNMQIMHRSDYSLQNIRS